MNQSRKSPTKRLMERKHTLRLHPSIFNLINKTLIDRSLKCMLISRGVILEKLKLWFRTIKPQEITLALLYLQHNYPDEKIALVVETENQAHRLCEVLRSFQIYSQYITCTSKRKAINYTANLLIVPYSLVTHIFMDKYYVIDFTSYLRLFRGVLVDKTENKSVSLSLISHDEQKQQNLKEIKEKTKSQTIICKRPEIVHYGGVQENDFNTNKEEPKNLVKKPPVKTNELDLYPLLQCDSKSDIVTNLLTVINSQSHQNIGEILLKLSTIDQICSAIKQSGCTSFLIQIIYSNNDIKVKKKGLQAMYNIITHDLDQQSRKQETKVYVLLDKLQDYTEALIKKYNSETKTFKKDNHPVQATAHLMKLTFSQAQRQSICQFGGIYIIANLVEKEHKVHGSTLQDRHCVLMRKYACMVLTNLTFDNSSHKSLLCSFREFMRALVVQLQNPNDELCQVTGSILRNLSWHADVDSKEILRQVGAVTGLMKAAMINKKHETLKSILSALWNLSAHCSENKAEICAIEGALGFLVTSLTFKESPEALTIIENSSGILRNISSQIAIRDDYREILRNNNGLHILLDQLKSPSITVVGNVCGILWNLSAKCAVDQELLWKMGAADILKTLNNSENKAIAIASSAALKNLLASRSSCASSSPVCLNMSIFKSVQKPPCDSLNTYLNDTPCVLNCPKINDYKTKFDNVYYCNVLNVGTSKSGCCQKNSLLSMIKQCKHTTFGTADKYSNGTFENDDVNEQPVDYSQKYSESSVLNVNTKRYDHTESETHESTFDYIKHSNEVKEYEKYGSYAETDLDQPTDYSLRYAEDDLDSDICSTSLKNDTNGDFIQDTVKTYCTEGTPYETPFNFSTATSLTDLRLDQNCDKLIKLPDNISDTEIIVTTPNEKDDVHLLENHTQKIPLNNISSELSSGLMSPEKPINYCEEGTPGYFSRVSSFGSLESISAINETKEDGEKQTTKPNQIDDANEKTKTQMKCVGTSSEVKTVKFGQVVNYAEETPLMFSRSSSLASLDSIEQHSIHDDRSSIISDFSRLTSGVVSPSELPDSPTQTLPHSPKLEKKSCNFPSTSRQIEVTINGSNKVIADVQTKSVFEDNVTKFKEESTPIQFSTTTSLSSLTIDDHFETQHSSVDHQVTDVPQKESYVELADDFSPASEDEDMLAACISIGMQKNRHISSKQNANCELSSPFDFTYAESTQKDTLNTSLTEIHEIDKDEPVDAKKNNTQSDTVRTYCTEDTPIGISRVCSHSDLSVLSIPENDTNSKKDYMSDNSSNFSGEDDKILAECIKSAMPKTRAPTTTKNTVINTEKLSKLNEKQIKNNRSFLFCDKLRKMQPLNFIQQYIPRRNVSLSSTTEPKNAVMYSAPCESPQVYCTEGTPVRLSRSGSQSDISLLSTREDEQKSKDTLDEPPMLSQNDSNMLDACIKLGMPKPRKHKTTLKETTKNTTASFALNFNRSLTKTSVKANKLNEPKTSNENASRNLKPNTYTKKSRLPSNIKTDFFNNTNIRTHFNDKQKCNFNLFKTIDDRKYTSKSSTLNKSRVFETNVTQTTHFDTAHSLNKNYFSDDSNLSGEDENILVECIKSAMPKPRETVNKFINNVPVKNETKLTKHTVKKEHKIFNLGRNNKVYEIERPSVLSNLFVPGYKNCRKLPLKHNTNYDLERCSLKQKSNSSNASANCNKNNKPQKILSGIPLPKTALKVPLCTSKPNAYGDSIQTYCTEDTPALLSHAGSHSDLSTLSITENDVDVTKRNLLEDECGNLTDEEDDDKILAACIKSAMPKPRQISNLPVKQVQTSQKKLKNEHSSGIKTKEKNLGLKKSGDPTNNSTQTKNNQQTKVPPQTLSLSNESLNMSDFDEALLDQCIFSAMPKNNTVIRKKN